MEKSHQNDQSCHPTGVSAGGKASTNCPPVLSPAVRRAMLEEIKNFDAKAASEEIENSAVGGASTDAYPDWLDQNGGHEPTEANPDVLAENDGIKYLPSKEDGEMANLLTEVRQFFSARELQVWNLVMRHNMTQQEAADLLKITRPSVQYYLRRAHRKFKAFLEAQGDSKD